MAVKTKLEPQNPLILRCHRLMEAFAKSDDERDFYLDRLEGFLIYVDLDKSQPELATLEDEVRKNAERYCLIPKLTFYEIKKIMEGFINEKVYDIDTKEKLLDIIQSREARENFLEFIYDHHAEFEKWQLYYQERSRVRIIEWLRNNHFHFVFEEDLDLAKGVVEKLKKNLFLTKVGKDIVTARKALFTKAKTYYSNEALNPRPKRGRPPKQVAKTEVEPQFTVDIYTTVESAVRPFLFTPDAASSSVAIFSSKFESDEKMLTNRRLQALSSADSVMENLNQKLASLRSLSSRWLATEQTPKSEVLGSKSAVQADEVEDVEEEDVEEDPVEDVLEEFDEEGEEDLEPALIPKNNNVSNNRFSMTTTKRASTAKKAVKKHAVKKAVKKHAVKKAVKRTVAKKAVKKHVVKKAVKRTAAKKVVRKKVAKHHHHA
jgi:hypothetical protein